ncbi:MAG: hypothetical protein AB2L12_11590 [Smithellaceae bacterium]
MKNQSQFLFGRQTVPAFTQIVQQTVDYCVDSWQRDPVLGRAVPEQQPVLLVQGNVSAPRSPLRG